MNACCYDLSRLLLVDIYLCSDQQPCPAQVNLLMSASVMGFFGVGLVFPMTFDDWTVHIQGQALRSLCLCPRSVQSVLTRLVVHVGLSCLSLSHICEHYAFVLGSCWQRCRQHLLYRDCWWCLFPAALPVGVGRDCAHCMRFVGRLVLGCSENGFAALLTQQVVPDDRASALVAW